jgi:hypothetical protein
MLRTDSHELFFEVHPELNIHFEKEQFTWTSDTIFLKPVDNEAKKSPAGELPSGASFFAGPRDPLALCLSLLPSP